MQILRTKKAKRKLNNDVMVYILMCISSLTKWCQFHQHFKRAFCANILAPKNFKPNIQLCNFGHKNIGAKSTCKMLMKLTHGRRFVVLWSLLQWI